MNKVNYSKIEDTTLPETETEVEKKKPHKPFGIASGVLYGIGCGVGGSIFILLGGGIDIAGPGVLISLILGGVLIFFTALNYSELETSLPIAGGAYNFTKEGIGGFLAFVIGFFLWLANVASCTFSALTFALVINSIFSFSSEYSFFLAFLSIIFISTIVLLTTKGGSKVLIRATIILVIFFSFFFILGVFIAPITNPEGYKPQFFFSGTNFFGVIQMFAALFIFFTSITSNLAYFNSDLRNPSKNIPKVNLLAILITLLIYIGVTSAVLLNLGEISANLSGHEILIAEISGEILGPIGFYVMVIAAILATLVSMNAALSSAGSIFHALARDHYVPKIFRKVNQKTDVPTYALLLTVALCIILTFFTNVGFAAEMTTFIYFIGLAFVNIAAVSLRYNRKKLDRPFKAPFFPYLPIGVGIMCLILAFTLNFTAVLFGMLVFTIGMTYYLITIADRSSIVLTLAGIKFFFALAVGIFILILNNLSVLSTPVLGFNVYFSSFLLRLVIFIVIFTFITILFDIVPLNQIIFFFIKKMQKDKVAMSLGNAQIIELNKTERKIIYYIDLLLGIIELACPVILVIIILTFSFGVISIEQIQFGSILLLEGTSEYLFLLILGIYALFLTLSGLVSLYINREIKKIGV